MGDHKPGIPAEPEHMDRWSRNARLHQTLKGMGLYVRPVPDPADPTRISHLVVAADLPAAQEVEEGPPTPSQPVTRHVVEMAENVVAFPSADQ